MWEIALGRKDLSKLSGEKAATDGICEVLFVRISGPIK